MTHDRRSSGTALSAKVNYQIEAEWDYAYLEAPTTVARGRRSRPHAPTRQTRHDPDGKTERQRASPAPRPAPGSTSPAPFPPAPTQVRFRYGTDLAVTRERHQDRQHRSTARSSARPRAEEGWTFDGFVTTTAYTTPPPFFNAYIAENRQYDGYDTSLRTAYNFGFVNTRPDWVETYPYQNGLLINYWDTSYDDNNVGDHPGKGLVLPVDAHPQFSHWPDGTLMRNRILSYDSTFGLERTDAITLHNNGVAGTIASKPARAGLRRHEDVVVQLGRARARPAPTRAATSRVGTASTCPRRARRSPSSTARSRATP